MTISDDARGADGSTWRQVGRAAVGVWVHLRTHEVRLVPAVVPSTAAGPPDPGRGELLGRLELMGDPEIFQAVTDAGRLLTDETGERPARFGSMEAAVRALADPGRRSIGATGPSSNDQKREL